jgi:hypothetical protein
MVPVQMADKNMIYPLQFNMVAAQLELGALGAINQKKVLIVVNHLR